MRIARPRSCKVHQWREPLAIRANSAAVLLIRVFADDELFRVRVVARIDSDFSTHLAASIAASGLKWISATIGTLQPRSRKLFDDVLEVARVLYRRRCDSDDLATGARRVRSFAGSMHPCPSCHR